MNRDRVTMPHVPVTVNQDRVTVISREITATRGRFAMNRAAFSANAGS